MTETSDTEILTNISEAEAPAVETSLQRFISDFAENRVAVGALVVFLVVMATGMKKMGVVGFIKAQAPHLDINPVLKAVLIPMIWAIEMFGLLIKHIVLAVRLFANMFAGHLVVGVFVAFIGVAWGFSLIWGVAPVVILASVAINLLEQIEETEPVADDYDDVDVA